MISADDLLAVTHLADLSKEDRTWMAGLLAEHVFRDGERAFDANEVAENMVILLSGAMQVELKQGDAWRVLDTIQAGSITGLLPYSRMTKFGGRGFAVGSLRVGYLNKEHFPELLYRIPVLGQRLVAMMSDRVRTGARASQEREKMLALGKLSAGLSHELNNPAAAARRAADDLRERLESLPSVVAKLARHGLDPEKVNPDGGFCSLSGRAHELTALELGDREDAILDWLEEHDVPDAWQVAPTLAEAGLTLPDLERAVCEVPPEAAKDVVAWIEHSLGTNRLLKEIHSSAARISELVGSVKAYSHMDRSSEVVSADLAEGIDNTLTMLGHKLKKKSIHVERDLGSIAPVLGHPGELNQVWTNLIDNAVDAMDDGGTLRIKGSNVGSVVRIEIGDTGHGIPKDVLPRIFEPFFTTKDVGEGTGLGLEIVHRIITKQHDGCISVASDENGTVFTIELPRRTS